MSNQLFTVHSCAGPLQIEMVDYHRNGIAGNGFHVVAFRWKDDDHKNGTRLMLGIVFEGECRCAILDRNLAAEGDIRFFFNSWRGDQFADGMAKAIEEYDRRDGKWNGPKTYNNEERP